jgi:hypothetical protein
VEGEHRLALRVDVDLREDVGQLVVLDPLEVQESLQDAADCDGTVPARTVPLPLRRLSPRFQDGEVSEELSRRFAGFLLIVHALCSVSRRLTIRGAPGGEVECDRVFPEGQHRLLDGRLLHSWG